MRLLLLTALSFAFAAPADSGSREDPEAQTAILFEFGDAEKSRWQVVNDGVMGGRSQGFVEVEDGALRFTGELVTRGGGFTSVRTDLAVDLDGYDGLELLVRGNGRTFEVEVSDGTRVGGRSVSRRASFPTSAEWTWVRVPFSSFSASIFGQPVRVEPLDASAVRGMGLYILDGQDGAFSLEVDEIRAYRKPGA